MNRSRVIIGGTLTYLAAVTVGYVYSSSKTPNQSISSEASNPDAIAIAVPDHCRKSIYSSNANKYDKEVGGDEFFMGLGILRWWHISRASGEVLEIGCGTGRNFDHYKSSTTISLSSNKPVVSVTGIDYVPNMLSLAKEKASSRRDLPIKLVVMDAHRLQFPDNSFDTVVDTFGLCSYEQPEKVLKEMARVCKKNGGKILLLEHGRGQYDWINRVIDSGADRHAHSWGCIWNRDIAEIIANSGLKVNSLSRWHFGTTYMIEASPVSEES